ncbi:MULTISPECIES: acyl-CoA dehydrogenase family protein [unclassified Rathayibacter]|uniref:acyl-CoA dehydrogenase family protein n=1 Tax=unclassified Rathayibacter TaxID=2609250 RepID=UPI001045E4CF|nr:MULTISPECIES: acyl-CoA dehydrogenase family protein [unclassified Rathayibacter]MCJ1675499.1 acyl-CoA dehydrogenase family protein [Rathayibacter sp. VKM Ac-2929]TCL79447.1 glutaryl-CoA dehydrogenase [Rathayibacter sp. PhB192]TCM25284.1 glutaryl-CoA dehydrogenase [Rathayibacter sp. PhB179]
MSTDPLRPVDVDFYALDDYLDDDDRAVVAKVRGFVQQHVLPNINEAWERADFPWQILPAFADLGIAGTAIQGYGCPGLTRLQTGLVAMELSRGDGSVNTLNAVQSGLAMGSIALLGSEEQKQRWLPDLAAVRKLGAFALTEPEHGSDSVALETSARRDGDHYVINGAKRWIGLGHIADVVILWARDVSDSKVKAFVLEKNADGSYPEGYDARAIEGKIAKRAIQQAHIEIVDVRIPVANRLEKSTSFRDVGSILNRTRSTVAWESLGHATAAYEIAARYVHERVQFGKPIASFQLVQNSLANMLADLTAMQLMCFRTGVLQDQGRLSNEQASLSKMFTGQKARQLCRDARDLLGGNGLLLENHVARHLTDMEVVHTYEGTDFIQSLIIGREITGISAFS